MRKLFSLMLVLALVGSLMIGCGSTDEPDNVTPETTAAPETSAPEVQGDYEDGIYFATEPGFSDSGWKGTVTVTVEGGNIVDVDWNAANTSAGKDKKTASADGDYGMVAKGNAQAEWHEQAELAEAYLIENQSFDGINYVDEDGHTDTIAGVSIHVNDFEALVETAMAQGPVGTGIYKDGTFSAEADAFSDSGWKDTVSFTVINGNIVAANWNAIGETSEKDKKTASIDGDYGMVAKGNASAEWHEQAMEIENYLISVQDLGEIDTIASVSISFDGFLALAEEALELR
jgi:major membrane immunogen (membrane-anchored lipoprotein)